MNVVVSKGETTLILPFEKQSASLEKSCSDALSADVKSSKDVAIHFIEAPFFYDDKLPWPQLYHRTEWFLLPESDNSHGLFLQSERYPSAWQSESLFESLLPDRRLLGLGQVF